MHLRQTLRLLHDLRVVGEVTVKLIRRQQQAARDLGHATGAQRAVGAGKAAAHRLGIAAAQIDIVLHTLRAQAGDAQCSQALEFARLADAVLVGVLPDA